VERPVTQTRVYINLSFPELSAKYARLPCDGVGLMRAEFLALSLGTHPGQIIADGGEEIFIQTFAQGLEKVARDFHPRPVTYRTLDLKSNEYAGLLGGDKFEEREENPMLGLRGCARYLADPASFRLELRAVRRVRESGLKNVRVMVPFVRFPRELAQCRQIIAEEGLFADPSFEFWMMAEVPSTVFLIDEFLPHVSGVSIGSNDLTQLILGIDRDSRKLASSFDERDPAVQKALEQIARATRRQNKQVSICGDAPSRHPEMVEQLVALGLTAISVSPEAFAKTVQLVADAETRLGISKASSL
jgi:pyruvate,water dikinase